MKIVLLKYVQGLGKAGDIKEVSDGYAKNFLFPNKLGELATKQSLESSLIQKKKKKN
jgi:large subunit ribosomal protein L9